LSVKDTHPICVTWFAETAFSKGDLTAGTELGFSCLYPDLASAGVGARHILAAGDEAAEG